MEEVQASEQRVRELQVCLRARHTCMAGGQRVFAMSLPIRVFRGLTPTLPQVKAEQQMRTLQAREAELRTVEASAAAQLAASRLMRLRSLRAPARCLIKWPLTMHPAAQIESKTVHKRELLAADEERRLQSMEARVTGGLCRCCCAVLLTASYPALVSSPTWLFLPPAAKDRDLAEQQQNLLAAKAEAERKLEAANARLKAVADREREAEQRHAQAEEKLEAAQAEVAEREAAAAQRAEQLAARERSLKRQEDGLEGLKVGAAHTVP